MLPVKMGMPIARQKRHYLAVAWEDAFSMRCTDLAAMALVNVLGPVYWRINSVKCHDKSSRMIG